MTREAEDVSADLAAALDAIRKDDDAAAVPSYVQDRVMAAWDQRSAQLKHRSATLAWVAAIAASVVAAMVLSRPGVPTILHLPWGGTDTVPSEVVGADLNFTDVAFEDDDASMQYLQMRLPQAALAELGLPIADPADAQTVVVEVLVGLDGVPRRLRLLAKEMP